MSRALAEGCRRRVTLVTALVALALFATLFEPVVRGEDVPRILLEALERIRALESRGVNVSEYTRSLGRLLEKHEACVASGSNECLEEFEDELRGLIQRLDIELGRSEKEYSARLALKVFIGALLMAAPIVTYVLLPRTIGLLWYNTKRRWLVIRRGRVK